jgi:hypothetical protein
VSGSSADAAHLFDQNAHALSIVPHPALIRRHERIRWIGCIKPPKGLEEIPIANSCNNHEFKPVYARAGSDLVCYIASPDVRNQVLTAWSLLNYGTLETVQDESGQAIEPVKVALESVLSRILPFAPQNLLIGRVNSFMIATQIAQKLRTGDFSTEQARAFLIHHETKRLSQCFKQDSNVNQLAELSQEGFRIIASDGFLQIVLYPSLSLLAVNLPWGPALATMYGQILCPHFYRTMIVGGVGSRIHGMEPEQVFGSDHLAIGFENPSPLDNILLAQADALDLAAHIGTLRSTHESLSSPRSRLQPLPASDAVDMEAAYILRFMGPESGCLHYVMDSSASGLGLSATYYNTAWLAWLASKPSRAKNLCYAAVLRLCGEGGAEKLARL